MHFHALQHVLLKIKMDADAKISSHNFSSCCPQNYTQLSFRIASEEKDVAY